jgi:hypothetical protein
VAFRLRRAAAEERSPISNTNDKRIITELVWIFLLTLGDFREQRSRSLVKQRCLLSVEVRERGQ